MQSSNKKNKLVAKNWFDNTQTALAKIFIEKKLEQEWPLFEKASNNSIKVFYKSFSFQDSFYKNGFLLIDCVLAVVGMY